MIAGNFSIASAAVKSGQSCSKLGATSTTKGVKYTCIKSGTKLVGKSIAKRIPIVGLAIGIFDAVNQAFEGDYDQAAMALGSGILSTIPGLGTAASIGIDVANAYIDEARGDNHVSTDDLLVRANNKTLMGSKGDALLFFNEMVLGESIVNAKPNKINLVLQGTIKNINRNGGTQLEGRELDDTIEQTSKMVLKQVITNLQTSAV